MYLNLAADGEDIRQGAIMIPYVGILGDAALFDGQLYVVDTATQSDRQTPPYYTGLNDRYFLVYADADEAEEVQEAYEEAIKEAAG